MEDVKGDQVFENKILALIFDIVFLAYNILYNKACYFFEYLLVSIVFKIEMLDIGSKAEEIYNMGQ